MRFTVVFIARRAQTSKASALATTIKESGVSAMDISQDYIGAVAGCYSLEIVEYLSVR